MNAELRAQLILAGYALIAAALVWREAGRCERGRKLWLLYALERLYCGLMFRFRANRRCPFPVEEPALIVANHRSPVDPLFLWMNHHLASDGDRIRTISFFMAREYYDVPSMRWLYRLLRCIPVDRDGRDVAPVREAIRRLQAGELFAIFPEGRLNTGEGLLPAGTGVAFLALVARVPVFPVFIHNAPQGTNMVNSFYTRNRVRVSYGDPVDLSEYYGRRKSDELLREVTDLLMHRVAELGGLTVQSSSGEVKTRAIPIQRAADA